MRELLLKTWLRPLVVGLSLWIGICAGSWATMRWLARSIQDRIEVAAVLDRDIEDARRTLAQLEVDTWGIVVHEIKGDRFVVVPDGALADPAWWADDRPGVEAVERVKEVWRADAAILRGARWPAKRQVRPRRRGRHLATAAAAAMAATATATARTNSPKLMPVATTSTAARVTTGSAAGKGTIRSCLAPQRR